MSVYGNIMDIYWALTISYMFFKQFYQYSKMCPFFAILYVEKFKWSNSPKVVANNWLSGTTINSLYSPLVPSSTMEAREPAFRLPCSSGPSYDLDSAKQIHKTRKEDMSSTWRNRILSSIVQSLWLIEAAVKEVTFNSQDWWPEGRTGLRTSPESLTFLEYFCWLHYFWLHSMKTCFLGLESLQIIQYLVIKSFLFT